MVTQRIRVQWGADVSDSSVRETPSRMRGMTFRPRRMNE